MDTAEPLDPIALAAAWYWTTPPPGWLLGTGDIFRRVPYRYRVQETGQLAEAPVLAACLQHPCDASNRPQHLVFARAYVLDEYLADNPRLWQSLPEIAAGRHFDFVLFPAFPSRWEADLIVDLEDQFGVAAGDVCLDDRLAGYWQTFGWSITRRYGRAGGTHPVPPFKTTIISPQDDGLPRPATIWLPVFSLPLHPGEADLRPKVAPPLALTHLYRAATRQDWWRAEWKGISGLAGYGRTPDAAVEHLVRAARRAGRRRSGPTHTSSVPSPRRRDRASHGRVRGGTRLTAHWRSRSSFAALAAVVRPPRRGS
ncbi:MAG: hypothetical protein ACRDJN_10495 [Chloroflexota bacterium]